MNIHHLELFYHVARHGGISAAVRHMPYAIQQPAVSSQIRQLEEDLGVKLFERQPFLLTPEGLKLIAFAGPFFDNIDVVGASLIEPVAGQIRIGASEYVLRAHLPAVMQRAKKKHPGLRLAMQDGPRTQLEARLRNRELDLVVSTAIRSRPGAGLRAIRIMELPLVLLVPRKSPIKAAGEIWSRASIDDPLVSSVPAPDNVFQQGLKRRGIVWRPTIEATSVELVTWYVAHGHGIGVSVALPELIEHRGVRALPLEGFDSVPIVATWRGKPTPMLRTIIEESLHYIREQWPQFACNDTLN